MPRKSEKAGQMPEDKSPTSDEIRALAYTAILKRDDIYCAEHEDGFYLGFEACFRMLEKRISTETISTAVPAIDPMDARVVFNPDAHTGGIGAATDAYMKAELGLKQEREEADQEFALFERAMTERALDGTLECIGGCGTVFTTGNVKHPWQSSKIYDDGTYKNPTCQTCWDSNANACREEYF